MKKYVIYFIIGLCSVFTLSAQEQMSIHRSGNVLLNTPISEVDSIKFSGENSSFMLKSGITLLPLSEIDSITFALKEAIVPDDSTISIVYEGEEVTITNPFEDKNITITSQGADVTVTAASGIGNIKYYLSGVTEEGSLTIANDQPIEMILNDLAITNPSGAAIQLSGGVSTTITLYKGTNNSLTDGTGNSKNATLTSDGELIFAGTGILNVKGLKKHAVASNANITVESGTIYITESASDGFHSEGFAIYGGYLDVKAGSDGIDAGGGTFDMHDGFINITSTTNDVKGIKSDANMTIEDGKIRMTVSGNQSKGLSCKKDITITGGDIQIGISGAAVLEASGSGYDPSYCTAIKSTGNTIIHDGIIHIEAATTNDGGKGFSADGDIIMYNGTVIITMAGSGATYTNENGEKDSYSSCGIKSDQNISLIGGTITCTSTGSAGKGISADGTLQIGVEGADNDALVLNVNTKGDQIYVSGSGDNADYANPKAVKSEGDLTVNSGTITIVCEKDGGEGLESKSTLTINGGLIDIKTVDDCINASTHISITGGTVYCTASGNDGIDSNGDLSITGGFVIARGARAPEGGIDCDNSTFAMSGGTVIGTGGNNSTPTANSSQQYSIIYSGTPGANICIKNPSGEIILLYTLPTLSGSSSGPGPGGGNNNQISLLFSDPKLTAGNGYSLLSGGTISGGTTVEGYNTGGTYSNGSTATFNITSKVTQIR